MLFSMLKFEWRYFIRQPSFIVTSLVFFLLPYLALAIENVRIGATSNTNFNSPFAITQITLILGVFAMFLVVNFVANTALRNDQTKLAEIVCTKPINALSYQLGRFLGAYLVCVTVFAMVPLGVFLGSLMPWLDAERIGANQLGFYLLPFFCFSLPTLFVLSALFYTAALKFRSAVAVYLTAIALFILYVVSGQLLDDPAYFKLAALTDPYGLRAFSLETRYWTGFERDSQVFSFSGVILQNRLIWVGVGLSLLAVFGGFWKPLSIHKTGEKRQKNNASEALMPAGLTRIDARSDHQNGFSQFVLRSVFEIKQIVKSPGFYVLLLFSGFSLISQLIDPTSLYDAPDWPLTQAMLVIIYQSFSLMMIIVIAYYSAEVVWRERGVGIGDIVDSMPVQNWVFWSSKLVAVCLVVTSLFIIGAGVTIPYQLIKGHSQIELGQYALTIGFFYVLPAVHLVVFAFLLQALSPNKYVGMLLFVGYVFVSLAFSELGLEHNLWNLGASPFLQYSDLNGYGWFLTTQSWYMLYWLCLSVVLGILSFGLWQRGPYSRVMTRLGQLRSMIGVGGQLVAVSALVVFLATGTFIYRTTTIENQFYTRDELMDLQAKYEQDFEAYIDVPIPAVTKVDATVDIFPYQRKIEASAAIRFTNKSDGPIDRFMVNVPANSPEFAVEMEGGVLEPQTDDQDAVGVALFRFDEPLLPGQTRSGTVSVTRHNTGFKDRDFDAVLVENGTFIDSFALFPSFGFDTSRRLADRYERRKRELPELERAFPLEDESHYGETFFGKGGHAIEFSATVSTSSDQIAIAPGYLVREWEEGGRNYFRYEQDSPILNFYSFLSGRMAVKRESHKGINIEVYYHPDHDWNVDRMIESAKDSLDYFSAAFGPYQHRQLRIIEFPGYRSFAQSFANTVPYSEQIGFITDIRDPDDIDGVYYVTAHEVAHQWWAHQVSPANVQGSAILAESLSQYSALMVMEQKYGEVKTRKFLTYELDRYLRGRTGELLEEMPMLRAESQPYIHYRKGSVVMLAIKDRLGEAAMNRALKSMVDTWAFAETRFPTTLDLVAAFKAEADPADHDFIDSQFNDITLYELINEEALAESAEDGGYRVTVKVVAKRFVADGKGDEQEQPMDDRVDIVLFKGDPDAFSGEAEVLYRAKHPVTSGENEIVIEIDTLPDYAGVDPFVRFIDRETGDNIRPVSLQ